MASVASRNPFALLGDSEEAEPVVKEQEPTSAKETVVVKKVDRSRASPKEARIRFDYPQRGSYKSSASNRSEDTRSAPRDRNVGPRLAGRREEGGGGGGGDYPTRNSRGARPNDRGRGGRGGRRGREFDRHSGTGRYDSEKKDTQAWGDVTASYDTNESPDWNNNTTETSGWNNNTTEPSSWNNNTTATETPGWNDATEPSEPSGWNEGTTDNNSGGWDEGKTEEKSGWDVDNAGDNNEAWVVQPEVVDDSKAEQAENATTSESAPVREPEEEVKTFDEYLAEKAQKSLDITLPEARKPNEGTDDSQWKNAVPLEKDEDEDFLFAGKEQSYRLKNKKSKSKTILEIEPTFTGGSPSRGRGRGRGGRGGRGGRDDGRSHRDNYDNDNRDNRDNRRRGGGGRGYAGIVNLDDQRAFPSLSAEKV